MTDLQELLSTIDELSPAELEVVYRHVVQRRSAAYWLVPGEHLKTIHEIMRHVYEQTAHMTEDEINAVIDEALDEARRERSSKTYRGH